MIEKLLKAISLNDEDYTQEKENINPEFTFFHCTTYCCAYKHFCSWMFLCAKLQKI